MQCSACGQENQEAGKPCANCGVAFSIFEATGVIPLPSSDSSDTSIIEIGNVGEIAAGSAALLVRKGPLEGVRFDLNSKDGQVITVGRSPESSIFLDDVTVSRKHASISRTENTWQILDSGSLNGTYVNRARVESTMLQNGDEVQIGKYRFTFLSGDN
jgi:pSer/pThr/pTyr-binding forkhead associated (FHA) protein